MSGLPEGWESCKVGDLFKSFSGGTPSRDNAEYWNGNIPWLSSGDIKEDRIVTTSELITEAGLNNSSAKLCRPGSLVVVVRSGILKHTLPVAILEKQAAINQDIKCFDSENDSLNQWLALSLKASAREILGLNREGTTVQSVKYDTLKEFELPVPPFAEQRRIVAKLETLLGKVDACQRRLAKIPVILKRFRQAVLAAACSGRLTTDWREENQNVESATSFIQSITANLQSLSPAVPGGAELPENWAVTNFGMLVTAIRGGSTAVPQNDPTNFPILRSSSVRPGFVDLADVKYVSEKDSLNESNFLCEGDLLFTRLSGSLDYVANCARVRGLKGKRIQYPDRLFCAKLVQQMNADYCELVFASPFIRALITENAKSSAGHQRVSISDITKQLIPVAPLAEQHEIVRRVEALFKLADQLEARYLKARAQVDKLQQSILARAFRGELVPTEAELARQEGRDYESADVLLERVSAGRHERAARQPQKTGSQPGLPFAARKEASGGRHRTG